MPLGASGRDVLNEGNRSHVVPRIGVGQGRSSVRVSCVRIVTTWVFFFPSVYALVTDNTEIKEG